MSLVGKIKDLCTAQDETFASLERKMDFGNGTIRKWNNAFPSADKLAKVAAYFNVPLNYLLGIHPFDYWERINSDRKGFLHYTYLSPDILSLIFGIDYSAPENATVPCFVNFINSTIERVKLFDQYEWEITLKEPYKSLVFRMAYEGHDDQEMATSFQFETPTEHKLKLLARHLNKIPEDNRQRLIENFSNSIDIYLDAMGIPKEDE